MNVPAPVRPPAMRVRQGLVLLAGAVVIVIVIGADGRAFYSTPFALGLTYLAAATAGGRRGGYWAGALVLCGWGAAVLIVRHAHPDLDTSGLYLLGAGIGAIVACLASRGGLSSDPLGAVATVTIAGAVLAVSPHWSALTDARTYALLVGLVGLANVVWGALGERSTSGR